MTAPARSSAPILRIAAQVISSWLRGDAGRATQMAHDVGETEHPARPARADLAVGRDDPVGLPRRKALMGIWYHFAILSRRLFIPTTGMPARALLRFSCRTSSATRFPLSGDALLDQQPRRLGARLPAVGYILYREYRPVRRHLDAVAALRHLQPDARGDRLIACTVILFKISGALRPG